MSLIYTVHLEAVTSDSTPLPKALGAGQWLVEVTVEQDVSEQWLVDKAIESLQGAHPTWPAALPLVATLIEVRSAP